MLYSVHKHLGGSSLKNISSLWIFKTWHYTHKSCFGYAKSSCHFYFGYSKLKYQSWLLFQLESSYWWLLKLYINNLQYFIYMYFQIKKLTKYSLPEKALKSFTFSEFWWSKVVIFKNCCFNQLALSSSNAFLYRNKQTKETLVNISTFTQLPFHTVSLGICTCSLSLYIKSKELTLEN